MRRPGLPAGVSPRSPVVGVVGLVALGGLGIALAAGRLTLADVWVPALVLLGVVVAADHLVTAVLVPSRPAPSADDPPGGPRSPRGP